MTKNTGIIFVIVIILIAGGVYALQSGENDAMMTEEQGGSMMEDESMIQEDVMMKDEGDAMMEEDDAMMKSGSYEEYSPEKLALADSGDVVLFFRAPWCPTCRALDADIRANAGSIPSGVAILDVDYDNSTAMKQKYGVTYQHTLVQVDSSGNLIAKWMGSPTLASLVTNIK